VKRDVMVKEEKEDVEEEENVVVAAEEQGRAQKVPRIVPRIVPRMVPGEEAGTIRAPRTPNTPPPQAPSMAAAVTDVQQETAQIAGDQEAACNLSRHQHRNEHNTKGQHRRSQYRAMLTQKHNKHTTNPHNKKRMEQQKGSSQHHRRMQSAMGKSTLVQYICSERASGIQS
jgi:hypothetical protein